MGQIARCRFCGKEFMLTSENRKYCSAECFNRFRLARQRPGCNREDLMYHNECAYCHKVFILEHQAKYCSYECSYHDANERRKADLSADREQRYDDIEKIVASYGEHIAPIPGHEKYYATDDGRIFTTHRGYWKEKAQHLNRGYCYVGLDDASMKVHQLVLLAFGKERPQGAQVRHLIGNRQDNRLSNLAWGTSEENAKDKRRHGTIPYGEKAAAAKLSDETVNEIVKRSLAGESMYALAREYGTSAASISRWRTGKIRKASISKDD